MQRKLGSLDAFLLRARTLRDQQRSAFSELMSFLYDSRHEVSGFIGGDAAYPNFLQSHGLCSKVQYADYTRLRKNVKNAKALIAEIGIDAAMRAGRLKDPDRERFVEAVRAAQAVNPHHMSVRELGALASKLAVSLTGTTREARGPTEITRLREENAQLREENAQLKTTITQLTQENTALRLASRPARSSGARSRLT